MKRVVATLLGILASFAGVLLWIFLDSISFIVTIITLLGFVDLLAKDILWIFFGLTIYFARLMGIGLASVAINILFYMVYHAVNPKDKSSFRFVVAAVVMVVDIVIAELLMWAVAGVSPANIFETPDILMWFILDIVIGLALSGICLGGYIAAEKKKIRMKKAAEQKNGQPPYPYAQNPYAQNPNPYAQNQYPYGQSPYPYGQQPAGMQSGATGSPLPNGNTQGGQTAAAYPAQTAPNVQPMPLKMRKITVRREKKMLACLVPVTLYCDGRILGTLKNGQMLSFEVAAGQPHSLMLSWNVNAILGMEPEYSPEWRTDAGEEDVALRTEMHNGFLNTTIDFLLVKDEKKAD